MTAKILEFKSRSKEEPKPVEQLMKAIDRDENGNSPMEAALEGLKQVYGPEKLKEMFDEFDEMEEANEVTETTSEDDSL